MLMEINADKGELKIYSFKSKLMFDWREGYGSGFYYVNIY